MSSARRLGIALAACVAAAVSGCGFGEGEATEGEVSLTVTRDHGSEPVLEASVADPTESDTVMRVLDAEAEITTRYGGGFVQSVNGTEGGIFGGRSFDWFFFVDGIESPTGAADVPVQAGDRVWWDYRDWTDAMRAPAVVGSWPEPFAQASEVEADREPVSVGCLGERQPCDVVGDRLGAAGVDARTSEGPTEAGGLRVLVGPWRAVSGDRAARQLDGGPETSGVFARFATGSAAPTLEVLDGRARVADEMASGSGLVAAVREGEDPPTWLVTGTDEAGVARAAEGLRVEALAARYAVAFTAGGEDVGLPVSGGGG